MKGEVAVEEGTGVEEGGRTGCSSFSLPGLELSPRVSPQPEFKFWIQFYTGIFSSYSSLLKDKSKQKKNPSMSKFTIEVSTQC